MFGLQGGLTFGCILGFMSGLISGLQVDFKIREKPNQGTFASIKNIPAVTLVTYPFGILVSNLLALAGGGSVTLRTGLVEGLSYALVLAFLAGGGLLVVRHGVLRVLLLSQGHIPHNYAQFLKYTTERRLTQQIGGRFRFIHRELLDHFAAMEQPIRSKAK